MPSPPSRSQAWFLLGVLTWVCFSEASLLTRLLAVVSTTQIYPLLVITEQQIFTSLLNLGETFSRTPWLVMSSAILQHKHKVLLMNNFPVIFSLFHVFVYLCLGGRSQAGDHLGSYEGIPLALFNLFYSGGKINICIPPVDQPPHSSSLHRRKSPNVSLTGEMVRCLRPPSCHYNIGWYHGLYKRMETKQQGGVFVHEHVCVLLAHQVYLTVEGKTVTSLFYFDVETHFLSSLLKWPRKGEKHVL